MSLAEELLADLEDDEDQIMDVDVQEANGGADSIGGNDWTAEKELIITLKNSTESTVKDVAKLYHSNQLKDVLSRIKEFSGKPRKAEELQGPVEADPEYILIVEANNLAAEIDEEITNIHKLAKDKYSKRFPELETLVVNTMDYLLTAKELGNCLENVKSNVVLQKFLNPATIMVVSVTASTTQGTHLSEKDLDLVVEAADTAVALNSAKIEVLAYVESRMAFIGKKYAIKK